MTQRGRGFRKGPREGVASLIEPACLSRVLGTSRPSSLPPWPWEESVGPSLQRGEFGVRTERALAGCVAAGRGLAPDGALLPSPTPGSPGGHKVLPPCWLPRGPSCASSQRKADEEVCWGGGHQGQRDEASWAMTQGHRAGPGPNPSQRPDADKACAHSRSLPCLSSLRTVLSLPAGPPASPREGELHPWIQTAMGLNLSSVPQSWHASESWFLHL